MNAYVFPGQGAQFTGMGLDLYESNEKARALFEQANEILGFRITDLMFSGSDEELRQTRVTQPAIFIHSVIEALCVMEGEGVIPSAVAGHSLGEFSAMVAAGAISFADGLRLVSARALAMQKACEKQPGTMAAVLGLPDEVVERVCHETDGVVVAANYNCPGQVVISGTVEAVAAACPRMKEAGAKRALPLPVGGAFHSPLMEPARVELAIAIEQTEFRKPICPIYQNVDGLAHTKPDELKANLLAQLTAPVRWTQEVENMIAAANEAGETFCFREFGPGQVLTGLIGKINR